MRIFSACSKSPSTPAPDPADGPDSGEAPIGSIIAEPGGSVAIEGAVCCK